MSESFPPLFNNYFNTSLETLNFSSNFKENCCPVSSRTNDFKICNNIPIQRQRTKSLDNGTWLILNLFLRTFFLRTNFCRTFFADIFCGLILRTPFADSFLWTNFCGLFCAFFLFLRTFHIFADSAKRHFLSAKNFLHAQKFTLFVYFTNLNIYKAKINYLTTNGFEPETLHFWYITRQTNKTYFFKRVFLLVFADKISGPSEE